MQRVGAFKFRGACNAVLKYLEENPNKEGSSISLCTHSSGNHAQAVALVGNMFNMQTFIVMPNNSNPLKKNAVQHTYKANLIECENTLQAREDTAARVCAEHHSLFIHPFDNSFFFPSPFPSLFSPLLLSFSFYLINVIIYLLIKLNIYFYLFIIEREIKGGRKGI